jgi:TnpA family transposase
MPRMKILNRVEREAFEYPPVFSEDERERMFAVPLRLQNTVDGLRTPTNQVCFVIAAGYFKARRAFFQEFRPTDLAFVARRLGVNAADVHPSAYDKQTRSRHRRLILDHFGFRPFDAEAKRFIAHEIATLVRTELRPRPVFLEAAQVLAQRRIALPSYFVLSTLVAMALTRFQRELAGIVGSHLTDEQQAKLDALLDKAPTDLDDGHRYRLTLLKKPYLSTRPSKIRANLEDLKRLSALYLDLQPVVTALALNQETVRYYAYSVIKSRIAQVSRRDGADRHLHLIAFVIHQTFRLNDILADTLLSAVQSAVNAAEKAHKESYYQERERRAESFAALADRLGQEFQETLAALKRIVADPQLSDREKVALMDAALSAEDARPSLTERRIEAFKKDLATTHQGQDYYALLEDRSVKLQHRVADTVRQLRFAPNCSWPALWEALQHYQDKAGAIDKSAPVAFLSPRQQAALTEPEGKFRVSLYKALLYIEVAAALKSGALNLLHSEKYRPLDDYLIPKADWTIHRAEYLRRAQLEAFADGRATLDRLDQALDARYRETHQRLGTGSNPWLTVRADGSFHVGTPKRDKAESPSLSAFFPERRYISLLEVLATVDRATDFLGEFEHWRLQSRRAPPPKKLLFAGIIGYGCDIGPHKLAQISKQLDENALGNTVNWYFSLDNVRGGNDLILRFVDRLELPKIYQPPDEAWHTSSDGQKFEVAVESLNANYSFKYLGKDKGVSVVTFIDPRDLMWHSTVISSAEREAAYVIDGLMHNDVVKSDIHSTDTHGYSEVIFAATHLLDFEFAPRIKGLGRQRLYAFKGPKHYAEQGHTLLPDRLIRPALIEAQWDEILRFIATLRLKVATASQLFRRLNSYSRQHPLYRALKEFGKIPKTLFILKYVDDLVFRQAIEKQLNKVEASNKFARAISFGHNQEFVQSEKEDQEIAEGCRRLIKNAIICWNYLYLSRVLAMENDSARRTELIEALRNGSVATWKHFNLHGEFDFSDERMADSIGLTAVPLEPLGTDRPFTP